MKVAALDLGSNTFLMLIAEVTEGRIEKVYRDELRVTRLGQGIHANRAFHPEALLRAEECFREYAEILTHERPDKILAMATSAARDAKNGKDLFALGEKYKIPIQIIPGQSEAQITFNGSTFDVEDRDGVCVIDVGGGSTEVIAQAEDSKISGQSLDIGAVRLTEMYVTQHPVSVKEREALKSCADEHFYKSDLGKLRGRVTKAIAVAGTPTTLAAVIQEAPYSDGRVHGFRIELSSLIAWRDRLAEMDLNKRKQLVGMDPLRADVMIAGIVILIAALECLGLSELIVSTCGVRYGVALLAEKEGVRYESQF